MVTHHFRCPTLQVQSLWEIVHSAMFSGIPQSKGAWTSPPVWLQAEEVKGIVKTSQKKHIWSLHSKLSIFTGLCLRGLWQHNKGAWGPLPPPEGEPPLLAGAPQVLRQEALQVLQLQLCLDAAAGQLISGWRWRRLSSLLLSAGIHQNSEWMNNEAIFRESKTANSPFTLVVLLCTKISLGQVWRLTPDKLEECFPENEGISRKL